MTVLFAGGELDAFFTSGNNFTDTADTARRDTNFARSSIRPRFPGFARADFSSLTEGWLHMTMNIRTLTSANQDSAFLRLSDSVTGQIVLQIDGDNGVFNFEYWNGASFTELAPAISFVIATNHKIDIHWKIADSGGIFELFLDGVSVTSFSGDTLLAGFTQIDRIQFHSSTSALTNSIYDVFYSEIIVADESTIDWRLATLAPNGAGNSTTWTGDDTDVSTEALDDEIFISSASADEVEQFTISDLSGTAAAMDVVAVVVAARSRNAITGPQNVQISIRTGGNDFFSSNLSGVSTGFTEDFVVYETNPDTSSAWLGSEVNDLEIGVKSIT